MKRIIILLAFSMLIGFIAQSQPTTKQNELQVYLIGGIKVLQPKYFNHPVDISPAFVPTVGSGVVWQIKKFQMGGEFSYTDGKKQTSDFGTIFTGISFNLIGGYNWSLGRKFKLSIQTGFAYSLYHLSLTDKNYTGSASLNTAIYHNFIYSIPLSGTLQRVNPNGTFIGVRAGYHFNIMPNEWRYMEGTNSQVFTADMDGFYFQIVFGGLFNLKQSQV